MVAHQTSGVEVPGSNSAFLTMILMRYRIIIIVNKSQGREGNLQLRQKKNCEPVPVPVYYDFDIKKIRYRNPVHNVAEPEPVEAGAGADIIFLINIYCRKKNL